MSLDLGRKAAKQLEKSATTLAGALADVQPDGLEDRPFAVLAACADALDALRSLRELTPAVLAVELEVARIEAAARDASERRRARFAGELSEALDAAGLRLSGRLPALECGPFTIELAGTSRLEVKLYYGPRIELIDTLDVDARSVVVAVQKALASIESAPLDEAAFLAELHTAWRVALLRRGLPPTEKAQIVDVLAEMAFGRQTPGFRANPSGKGFQSYGRLQFSHDLGRLRHRQIAVAGGAQDLALTVATRDQTKKAADHLWVAGTHFALLSFRSAS